MGQQVLVTPDLVDWVPHKTDLLRNSAKGMELITLEGDQVTTISPAKADQFAFSNDGQKLAYTQQDRNEQTQLKVFELAGNKEIDVATFSPPQAFNLHMLNSSIVYQQNNAVWIVPAKANQSPIELFSPGVLVGVVEMP